MHSMVWLRSFSSPFGGGGLLIPYVTYGIVPDRLVMALAGAATIRDVIAFPKTMTVSVTYSPAWRCKYDYQHASSVQAAHPVRNLKSMQVELCVWLEHRV